MSDITRTKAEVKGLAGSIYVASATAGGTIESGELVYLDGTNGWKRADASAAASVSGLMGILVAPQDVVSGDEGLSIVIFGRVAGYSGMTPGALCYASDNDGEIADATGSTDKRVGYAETATILFVQLNAPANPT